MSDPASTFTQFRSALETSPADFVAELRRTRGVRAAPPEDPANDAPATADTIPSMVSGRGRRRRGTQLMLGAIDLPANGGAAPAPAGTAWLSRQHPLAFSLLVAIPVGFAIASLGAFQLSGLEREQKEAAVAGLATANGERDEANKERDRLALIVKSQQNDLASLEDRRVELDKNLATAHTDIKALQKKINHNASVDDDIWADVLVLEHRPVGIDIMGYLYYFARHYQEHNLNNEQLILELATTIRAQLDRARAAGLPEEFTPKREVDFDNDGVVDMIPDAPDSSSP